MLRIKTQKRFLSKYLFSSVLELEHFNPKKIFIKDFEIHKNNMKMVSHIFFSLSIQEKLHWKSYFITQIRKNTDLYKNSKAIGWLLNEKNVSLVVKEALKELDDLNLKELSDLMVISEKHFCQTTIQQIILKMSESIPLIREKEELKWILQIINMAKINPTFTWNTAEKIVDWGNLVKAEKLTRKTRSTNQTVQLFLLFKEFNYSELCQLQINLLNVIIEEISRVDPEQFLLLIQSLFSHFLFEFSENKINGQQVAFLLEKISLEEIKNQIPTFEILERLCFSQYDPLKFEARKFLKTASLLKNLISSGNIPFFKILPELTDKIVSIALFNLETNLYEDKDLTNILKIIKIKNKDYANCSNSQLNQRLIRKLALI